MVNTDKFTEQEWWEYLHDPKQGRRRQRRFGRKFKGLFPRGHKCSLRSFLLEAKRTLETSHGSPNLERLEWHIHPDAFEIVAKYGIDYTPHVFRRPPPFGEPKKGWCYLNAYNLATGEVNQEHDYRYVEGVVVGHETIIPPMWHAWNAKTLLSTTAVDWSFYATSRYARYLGIPFTAEEARMLSQGGSIFYRKEFTPRVKKRLIDILEGRSAGHQE